MNKVYQVIYQDEWDNLIQLGFYNKLEDAVNDINNELEEYDISITKEDLKSHSGMFEECFDLDISLLFDDRDDIPFVKIRGFIFNKEFLIKEIEGVK